MKKPIIIVESGCITFIGMMKVGLKNFSKSFRKSDIILKGDLTIEFNEGVYIIYPTKKK